MENPKIKWRIEGYPHFRKPPYNDIGNINNRIYDGK
jgi:hypothetical protein